MLHLRLYFVILNRLAIGIYGSCEVSDHQEISSGACGTNKSYLLLFNDQPSSFSYEILVYKKYIFCKYRNFLIFVTLLHMDTNSEVSVLKFLNCSPDVCFRYYACSSGTISAPHGWFSPVCMNYAIPGSVATQRSAYWQDCHFSLLVLFWKRQGHKELWIHISWAINLTKIHLFCR